LVAVSLFEAGGVCTAYGDCNTEGFRTLDGSVYAQLIADAYGLTLMNCGHTMSTTRELLQFADAFPASASALVLIQYGLVDSWLTFRGSPNILYCPDNPRRKLARKLVKKFKKWACRLQLQKILGAIEQVPIEEFLSNIRLVVRSAPNTQFVLVATAPNLDEPRNPRIMKYNEALSALASEAVNAVYADAWHELWEDRDSCLMSDGTHLTAKGHRLVANSVQRALAKTLLSEQLAEAGVGRQFE
jgi:lysophospholipase L1-like esterase